MSSHVTSTKRLIVALISVYLTLGMNLFASVEAKPRDCEAVQGSFNDTFAGYVDHPFVGRCCKKGNLRVPQCWVNSCGERLACIHVKPYCVCIRGYTGADCCTVESNVPPTPAPPSPQTTTSASSSTSVTTSTTTTSSTTTTTTSTTTAATTTTATTTIPTTTTAPTTTTLAPTTTTAAPMTTTTSVALSTTSATTDSNSTAATTTTPLSTTATAAPSSTTVSTSVTASSTAPPTTMASSTVAATSTSNSTSAVATSTSVASTAPTTTTSAASTTSASPSSSSSSTTSSSSSSVASTTTTTTTTATPPSGPATTEAAQSQIQCELEISTCGSNSLLFPGSGFNGRTGTATNDDVAAEASTTAATTSTTQPATTATTASPPTTTATTLPGQTPAATITVAPTTTLPPTSANKMPEIVYFAPDDSRQINSYIAKSREQYFATLPLRFGLQSSQVAVYLANYAQLVADKITGAMWIETDFTIRLAKASIPQNAFSVSAAFNLAVSDLPATFAANPQAYYNFVNRFGTHYVASITLGARASHVVEKSYCEVDPRVALDEEVERITGLVAGDRTDFASLDKVIGGPTRAQLLANGLNWWADKVTLANAVRIEVDLKNISILISDKKKAAGIDQAVIELMPTPDQPYLPPILECLLSKLSPAQIAGIVAGGVAGLGLIVFGFYMAVTRLVGDANAAAREVIDDDDDNGTGQKAVPLQSFSRTLL